MFGKNIKCRKLMNLAIVLLLFAFCIMTLVAVYATWKEDLAWEDEFKALHDDKWYHVITGNRYNDTQFQYYRRDKRNSYIKDGTLYLRATLVGDEEMLGGYQNSPGCNVEPCIVIGDPQGDCILPVYSAQLRTRTPLSVSRGRVAVRARFPSGDWLRAVIALVPEDSDNMSEGLIVAEGSGNKNFTDAEGRSLGADTVRQSLDATARGSDVGERHWDTTLSEGYFSDDFHVYEVEWENGRVIFRVDGEERGGVTPEGSRAWKIGEFAIDPDFFVPWSARGASPPPVELPFRITLKLAAGGRFFEDSFRNAGYPKPWNGTSKHPVTDFYEGAEYYGPTWDSPELAVDYIKVRVEGVSKERGGNCGMTRFKDGENAAR